MKDIDEKEFFPWRFWWIDIVKTNVFNVLKLKKWVWNYPQSWVYSVNGLRLKILIPFTTQDNHNPEANVEKRGILERISQQLTSHNCLTHRYKPLSLKSRNTDTASLWSQQIPNLFHMVFLIDKRISQTRNAWREMRQKSCFNFYSTITSRST